MKAILGKKMGMTQIFDEDGNVIPVTVIEAGPEISHSDISYIIKKGHSTVSDKMS